MQCRDLDCGCRDDGGPPNRSNQQPKEPGHTGLIVTGVICSIIIVGFLGEPCFSNKLTWIALLPLHPSQISRIRLLEAFSDAPWQSLSALPLHWPCVAAHGLPNVKCLCMLVPESIAITVLVRLSDCIVISEETITLS